MTGSKQVILFATLVALLGTGSARADESENPVVQRRLRAMANADTDGHPDLAGEFDGMRYYAHRKYKQAMERFLSAAYFADKLSQLCIGLMYRDGQGVARDPVTAYAWLDLAAERDYGEFVATRDDLKPLLSSGQLEQARALHEKLAGTYGDAVAKPRLIVELRLGRMALSGSGFGFHHAARNAYSVPGLVGDEASATARRKRCAGPRLLLGVQEAPIQGCGGDALYAKEFWDPVAYFRSRDFLWKAEVKVGDVEEVPNDSPAHH